MPHQKFNPGVLDQKIMLVYKPWQLHCGQTAPQGVHSRHKIGPHDTFEDLRWLKELRQYKSLISSSDSNHSPPASCSCRCCSCRCCSCRCCCCWRCCCWCCSGSPICWK